MGVKVAVQDSMHIKTCFGCGTENPRGLGLKTHWNGKEGLCTFRPEPHLCAGPTQFVNGGVVATLIDCHSISTAIAYLYEAEGRPPGSEPGIWCVTASLHVDYKRPTPIDRPARLTARVVVVVTDLHPHRFWLAPEADLFVVATPEVASECRQRGIAPERVRVIGIPIAKAFHLPVDRSEVLRRFHLDPQRRTVLVTSGGMTVGPFEAVVEALLRLEEAVPGRIQLLVVCGENRAATHRLERRAREGKMPARVFGFVDNMPELMGASDLVVAKAGGLTVMETLSEGLPLILYHAIPGQERFNAQYVERSGAALWAHSPADVTAAVRRYLDDPAAFAVMRDAARRLSRPDAAEAIVSQVIR